MNKADAKIHLERAQYLNPCPGWECGREHMGNPCALGPDTSGRCGATCVPEKRDDRYYCGASSKLSGRCDIGPQDDGSCGCFPPMCQPRQLSRAGSTEVPRYQCTRGECLNGPGPDGSCGMTHLVCRPRRNIRSRRGVLTLTVTGAAIGSLLLAMFIPGPKAAFSPGSLSEHHLALNDRCENCHDVGNGSIDGLFRLAFFHSKESDQSLRCQECHEELGEFPLHPHSLSQKQLQTLTNARLDTSTTKRSSSRVKGQTHATEELACATCHQEHRGPHFDISTLTNQQCQGCHQDQFKSFSNGHPEFESYPHRQRTQIRFNHNSHYEVHFGNFNRTQPFGSAPLDSEGNLTQDASSCKICHVPDPQNQKMVLTGFDQMCSSCHASQIRHDVTDLGLFSLPIIEPDDESSRRLLNEDGALAPLTELLLLADPNYRQGINDDQLEPASVEHATLLQSARQALVEELVEHHELAIRRRLEETIGDLVSSADLDRISALFPLVELEKKARELGAWDGAGPMEESAVDSSSKSLLTVAYSPTDHADPLLVALIELGIKAASADSTDPQLSDTALPAAHRLLSDLAAPLAAGRCFKCHTIEKKGGIQRVNWFGDQTESLRKSGLTRFEHGPHLIFSKMGEDDCHTCHRLNGFRSFFSDDYVNPFGDLVTDTSAHSSVDFKYQTKSQCAKCHNAREAKQDCLTCHRYHSLHERVEMAPTIGAAP